MPALVAREDNIMTHNFNSGPSILPSSVVEQAAAAIHNFNETGLSILEIGHRTPAFTEVMEEARAVVKQLMHLDEQFEVLFLHGGATTQFMQVPMNLLDTDNIGAYCINGIWGTKAEKEARLFGNTHVASDTVRDNHTTISKDLSLPQQAAYLHITTNNTVEGTQWHEIPDTDLPLVADMSSDIFSRQLPFSKFSLIYAGAQKNVGAAGVSLVVVNKQILGHVKRQIPAIMDYRNHIAAGSLLNTPPVFAVYVSLLTLRWILQEGGLHEMERRTKERATLLYKTIDRLPLFRPRVNAVDRSLMNITFEIKDKEIESLFLEECRANKMVGIKGYRTVGGLRVSLYNAMPMSSVAALAQLMEYFNERYLK